LLHDLLDATVAAATTSLIEGTVTLPTGTDIVIPAMMYIYCFFLSFLHCPARKHNHKNTHTHTHTKFGFQKNQESRKQKKLDIGSCTHRQWHSIRTADETMAVQRKRRRRRRRKAVETLQWQEQSSSDREWFATSEKTAKPKQRFERGKRVLTFSFFLFPTVSLISCLIITYVLLL
jgi:hypothetical protein